MTFPIAIAEAAPRPMRGELVETLEVPDGKKVFTLEWMRTAVTKLSGTGMEQALDRASYVRGQGGGLQRGGAGEAVQEVRACVQLDQQGRDRCEWRHRGQLGLQCLGLGRYVLGRQRRHHPVRILIQPDQAGVVGSGARPVDRRRGALLTMNAVRPG
ncbi:hypothetical protein ACTMTI_51570 [Nonomuraea sp. H19]|uniref:hypothetical protein n=1 Tax=Nonomuraea sp. H19 TaxID=3452206 RepID=UPI003F8B79ED